MYFSSVNLNESCHVLKNKQFYLFFNDQGKKILILLCFQTHPFTFFSLESNFNIKKQCSFFCFFFFLFDFCSPSFNNQTINKANPCNKTKQFFFHVLISFRDKIKKLVTEKFSTMSRLKSTILK